VILIVAGIPSGVTNSTWMLSPLGLIAPAAKVVMGDDGDTADSLPSRARFGGASSRRARSMGE
jgi:hypothetical protein